MAKVSALNVKPNRKAWRYVFPLESLTVKTWELEPAPRIATAIQSPAVVFVANASELEVAVLASIFLCCTSAMLWAVERLEREKFAVATTPDTDAVTV